MKIADGHWRWQVAWLLCFAVFAAGFAFPLCTWAYSSSLPAMEMVGWARVETYDILDHEWMMMGSLSWPGSLSALGVYLSDSMRTLVGWWGTGLVMAVAPLFRAALSRSRIVRGLMALPLLLLATWLVREMAAYAPGSGCIWIPEGGTWCVILSLVAGLALLILLPREGVAWEEGKGPRAIAGPAIPRFRWMAVALVGLAAIMLTGWVEVSRRRCAEIRYSHFGIIRPRLREDALYRKMIATSPATVRGAHLAKPSLMTVGLPERDWVVDAEGRLTPETITKAGLSDEQVIAVNGAFAKFRERMVSCLWLRSALVEGSSADPDHFNVRVGPMGPQQYKGLELSLYVELACVKDAAVREYLVAGYPLCQWPGGRPMVEITATRAGGVWTFTTPDHPAPMTAAEFNRLYVPILRE